MMIPRIYQPLSLQVGLTVRLDERASHHVSRVLRSAIGDQLALFNGETGDYSAIIRSVTKQQVTVEITHFLARHTESALTLHLAQGVARGEKMDFILQKAVELGVTQVTPLITERCQGRMHAERVTKRLHHWRAVIESACEQSGRCSVPNIVEPVYLNSWLAQVQQIKTDHCFVLLPDAQYSFAQLNTLTTNATVVLLVGPEGGFSQAELKVITDTRFQAVRLGPRVLRTETAAMVAMSILQYCYGDLRS